MLRLSAQAARLLKLQRLYERAIPAALSRHGRVANMKSGIIVIHAQNGAVAAKIRQLTPRLAEVFRQEGVDLNEIRVRVQPNPVAPVLNNSGVRSSIGIETKQGLTLLAQKLPPDSPLRGALDRFVERSELRTTKR
jgi:hypothetical protein